MLGFTSLIYLCLFVSPSRPSGAWKVLTQQDGRVEFASRDDVARCVHATHCVDVYICARPRRLFIGIVA